MIEQLELFPQEIDEQKEVAMNTTGLETNWDDYILNKDILTSQSNSASIVILGDSLTVLRQIKSNSIDLIFADPPYNINKDFGNNRDKWDSVKDYIEWCKSWIDECMRVLKDSGTMYFMTATQHMPYLDVYVSETYNVLCRIIWSYDSSGVQSKKMFGSLYEPILMINKTSSAQYTFNCEDILVEAKTGAQRKLIDYRKDPPQPYNTKKVPGNVWEFTRVRFKMDEYENHPTQKPESLLERIVLASSNPGDTVLDPFSGSFTTSAVAVRLGRRAIGIDLNDEYFEIGIRRTGISDEYNGKNSSKKKREKQLQNQNSGAFHRRLRYFFADVCPLFPRPTCSPRRARFCPLSANLGVRRRLLLTDLLLTFISRYRLRRLASCMGEPCSSW